MVRIKKEVFNKFNPKLRIGLIKVNYCDNKSKLKQSQQLLKEVEQVTRMTFNKTKIKDYSLIAPWRVAQEEFGKKAQHYHTSVERLLKVVLKRKSVATKDVLTNLVRYLSLKYLVPFGLDDYSKISGDLTFSLATGREKVGMLRKVKKGVLYYKDNKIVLGTKLDYWKSKKTALSSDSKFALVHLEALPPVKVKELNRMVKEAKELISSFCQAEVKSAVLHQKKNFVSI